MNNSKRYLPKDKEDVEFVNYLKMMNIEDIISDIPILLEWLQDGNWLQAQLITQYLLPNVNIIKSDIIDILRGGDEMWKYWVLNGLLSDTNKKLDNEILIEIERLYLNPSEDEKEVEVNLIAYSILKNNNYPAAQSL